MLSENEKVLKILTKIFRGVFDDDQLLISETTSAADIDEWDSLAQINLVLGIEATFDLKFDPSEIEVLENIGDMVQLIIRKNNHAI
ncbi:MAG: acyl carrier protein [Magnetococcales bacterium]|nr:acyl carrier protein [Magnetococcales bacterium]